MVSDSDEAADAEDDGSEDNSYQEEEDHMDEDEEDEADEEDEEMEEDVANEEDIVKSLVEEGKVLAVQSGGDEVFLFITTEGIKLGDKRVPAGGYLRELIPGASYGKIAKLKENEILFNADSDTQKRVSELVSSNHGSRYFTRYEAGKFKKHEWQTYVELGTFIVLDDDRVTVVDNWTASVGPRDLRQSDILNCAFSNEQLQRLLAGEEQMAGDDDKSGVDVEEQSTGEHKGMEPDVDAPSIEVLSKAGLTQIDEELHSTEDGSTAPTTPPPNPPLQFEQRVFDQAMRRAGILKSGDQKTDWVILFDGDEQTTKRDAGHIYSEIIWKWIVENQIPEAHREDFAPGKELKLDHLN
ncbi:hypothetical protein CYMTET_40851 [Cymbomonas tetramitiformis]|uniref:Uncharacterized protein n=1 Tax=Cymbomonas tetramitiformis TaxID=36881 RepID=A0AAE0C9A6_9CHLO|nr:hypothetical protein CYMTET_40851 [Cymbomonas tetramitiformis]